MSKNISEKQLNHAIRELEQVVYQIEGVRLLYIKPQRLKEELNSTTRAIDNINRTIQRIKKRLEILNTLQQ